MQTAPPSENAILLTICIATFNRADWISQTLDALLAQITPEIEIVIVDGASTDATQAILAAYMIRHPKIVYRREASNSGVDCDFDKAVTYASGEFCWLMSDDDIIVPGAIAKVLDHLNDQPQLVIVNSEICDKQLSTVLKTRQLVINSDREYDAAKHEKFFSDVGSYLSFIGAVVVRRTWWLGRERAKYYGSLFIHMGVIFQLPAPNRVRVIAEPLIRIRYGNALWTARAFEIWVCKWPQLIWSFSHFTPAARQSITLQFPATSLKTLLWYRALGAYSAGERAQFLVGEYSIYTHILAITASRLPVRAVNAALAVYCYFSHHGDARMKLYDLSRVNGASQIARWLAKRSRFPETEK